MALGRGVHVFSHEKVHYKNGKLRAIRLNIAFNHVQKEIYVYPVDERTEPNWNELVEVCSKNCNFHGFLDMNNVENTRLTYGGNW